MLPSAAAHEHKQKHTIHVTLPGSDRGNSEALTLLLAAIKEMTGFIFPLSLPWLYVCLFVF